MVDESHSDEESRLLVSSTIGAPEKTEKCENRSFGRLLSVVVVLSLCFVSLACIGSSVGTTTRLAPMSFESAADMLAAEESLLMTGDTAVQTVTYLYIKGKKFICDHETFTAHCKMTPESLLHDPRNATRQSPIMYRYVLFSSSTASGT